MIFGDDGVSTIETSAGDVELTSLSCFFIADRCVFPRGEDASGDIASLCGVPCMVLYDDPLDENQSIAGVLGYISPFFDSFVDFTSSSAPKIVSISEKETDRNDELLNALGRYVPGVLGPSKH